MKTKTVTFGLDHCWQCGEWYKNAYGEYRCMRTGEVIDLYGGIPESCPLPEKETDQEKLRKEGAIR